MSVKCLKRVFDFEFKIPLNKREWRNWLTVSVCKMAAAFTSSCPSVLHTLAVHSIYAHTCLNRCREKGTWLNCLLLHGDPRDSLHCSNIRLSFPKTVLRPIRLVDLVVWFRSLASVYKLFMVASVAKKQAYVRRGLEETLSQLPADKRVDRVPCRVQIRLRFLACTVHSRSVSAGKHPHPPLSSPTPLPPRNTSTHALEHTYVRFYIHTTTHTDT